MRKLIWVKFALIWLGRINVVRPSRVKQSPTVLTRFMDAIGNANPTGFPVFVRVGVVCRHLVAVLAELLRGSTWNRRVLLLPPKSEHLHALPALPASAMGDDGVVVGKWMPPLAVRLHAIRVRLRRVEKSPSHVLPLAVGSHASFAPPHTIASYRRAALNIGVAIGTLGFKGCVSNPVTLSGQCLQVLWIAAKLVLAFVVNIQPIRRLSDKKLVGDPVGNCCFPRFKGCNSVAVPCHPSYPVPAISLPVELQLRDESIKQWGSRSSSSHRHNKKPTPTSEVKPAVNRGNAYQGGQDMFSRFWRLLQSRALMVPIPA